MGASWSVGLVDLDCDRLSHCWLDRSVGKGLYIYDLHKEGGGGGGAGGRNLQICHVFADSFIFKQKFCCSFLQMEGVGGSQHIYIYIYIYDIGMLIYICMSVYI